MNNAQSLRCIAIVLGYALSFFASGCATSEVRAKVDHDPLPLIEKYVTSQASDKWRVYHQGNNHIEIVDTWPLYSVFSLGYSAMHGKLKYKDGEFVGAFYLRTVSVGNLFIPVYLDMSARFFGAAVKPYMRKKTKDILDAGQVPVDARVMTHSHDVSEYE